MLLNWAAVTRWKYQPAVQGATTPLRASGKEAMLTKTQTVSFAWLFKGMPQVLQFYYDLMWILQ